MKKLILEVGYELSEYFLNFCQKVSIFLCLKMYRKESSYPNRLYFYFSLLLFFLFVPSAHAFFVTEEGGESVRLLEKNISLEVQDEKISVTLSQTLQNFAPVIRTLRLWEPMRMGSENVHFYIDLEGKGYDLLADSERLEVIFDRAKEYQDVRFFRFGKEDFPLLFRSREIEIPGLHTIQTKLTWEYPADFIDDFFFTELFLDDGIEVENFEISLLLDSPHPRKHFFAPFFSSEFLESTENALTVLEKRRQFLPQENLNLFWSEVEHPVLRFPYKEYIYEGDFLPPTSKEIQDVTLLIDRSGSMQEIWRKTQDMTKEILEYLGETVPVQIGFVGEGVENYKLKIKNDQSSLKSFDKAGKLENKNFYGNNFEFRKEFTEFLYSLKPVGVLNTEKVESFLFDTLKDDIEERAVIFITDEKEEWELPALFFEEVERLKIPLMLLSFADKETDLKLLSILSGGKVQKLFYNSELVEKDEFEKKWEMLKNGEEKFIVEREERTKENLVFSQSARFLPRMWAERRIAEILKEFILPPRASEEKARGDQAEKIDALLAIGRTFGVQTSLFDAETIRDELLDKIHHLDSYPEDTNPTESPDLKKSFWRAILQLKKGEHISSARFLGALPFYKEDGKWFSFDFLDRVNSETLLQIAPFSEAQKELFMRFPNIFSEIFGIGEEVSFCGESRCISIEKGKRVKPIWLDRMWWQKFVPSHWANPYLWKMVKKELFEPDEKGNVFPSQGVTRAEIARIIYLVQQKKDR